MTAQPQGQTAPTIFTFQNGKPHPVRIYTDAAGEPLFHAADLCELLEYVNPRQALAQHVEKDDVTKRDVIDRMGRTQQANFVAEPGMWALLLGSHAPNAKKVKRWVTSEVLPALRKTGRYEVAKPQIAEEYITPAQYHEFKSLVYLIGHSFHMTRSAEWGAWTTLRKALGVEAAAKIPADRYEEARRLLKDYEQSSIAFKSAVMDIEKLFLRRRFSELPPELSQLEQQQHNGSTS